MKEKYVLSELDNLKDKLISEYRNSRINFECFFTDLKRILLEKEMRCLFFYKNGKIECRNLPKEQILPIYSFFPTTINNICRECENSPIPQDKIEKTTKDFKLKIVDNCILYFEI